MNTIRLTAAQAIVNYLAAQQVQTGQGVMPLFGGVWAIFGHGNVAGMGEALHAARDRLPTLRAHNEQGMAHAAIAYAKAHMRRRMMAVTTSIGPGATNLVTAAALAHVNRLPVLLLPADTFVSRLPDPVLQQIENAQDGTTSVNDCLRPVSRYFDRITHPVQLLQALPRALATLLDPVRCGPVTLALPQDVQTMAFDFPIDFFQSKMAKFRVPEPEPEALDEALALLRQAKKPLLIAGGGVLYSAGATQVLQTFCERHGIPVAETQAGKSALPWDHAFQMGPIGVTGSTAANTLAREADVVIAVGTRLQDFTTGSNSLFAGARVIGVNVCSIDAQKNGAVAVCGDARKSLHQLSIALDSWSTESHWQQHARAQAQQWRDIVTKATQRPEPERAKKLPYDGEVIGAVQRSHAQSTHHDIVVCAAGTLPGELHKLWRTAMPGGYHMEYGFSCMGYEIAGGLGVKMARPECEVIVMLGDGSYLMMNSEIASSVMLGHKLIIVVQDNGGYGCINRLQQSCGGAPFNNLLEDCLHVAMPKIDFAAHARALGAHAEHVSGIAELEQAMLRARASERTYLICIDTDPHRTTEAGGCWWEVAVPEVSARPQVDAARQVYEAEIQKRSVAQCHVEADTIKESGVMP